MTDAKQPLLYRIIMTPELMDEIDDLLKPRHDLALAHAEHPMPCTDPECKVCHGQTDWSTLE